MWLALTLWGCTEYGFGSDPVPNGRAGGDTDVALIGDGDTDPSHDTDSGEGTIVDNPDDTDPTDDTGADQDTDGGEIPDIPTKDDCALAVDIFDWLDQFQVPGDDRVYFCHSGSGGNYSMVGANVDSCLKHLDHPHDIFPATLCDT